jgi:hypothetical protein
MLRIMRELGAGLAMADEGGQDAYRFTGAGLARVIRLAAAAADQPEQGSFEHLLVDGECDASGEALIEG